MWESLSKEIVKLCESTPFKNNVKIIRVTSLFQISVLLERIYLMTKKFACLVKKIHSVLKEQGLAHLVRLEQLQWQRKLDVVVCLDRNPQLFTKQTR